MLHVASSDESQSHLEKCPLRLMRNAIVAGIVGRSQFSYGLWGDTVNITHRLQIKGGEDKERGTANSE